MPTVLNLAELVVQPDEPIGVSNWVEVSQHMIDAFAAMTGDAQWIHTDPVRAAGSPFGAPIAHEDDAERAVRAALRMQETMQSVAAEVQFLRDLLGFEHLTIFPHLLGDPYKKADEQMARFADEVVPLLS